MFTCTTQRGYQNRVRVKVTNKICPALDLYENVTPSTKETFIGTEVFFSCPSGYTRNGLYSTLCREDGNHSFYMLISATTGFQPPGPLLAPSVAPYSVRL